MFRPTGFLSCVLATLLALPGILALIVILVRV